MEHHGIPNGRQLLTNGHAIHRDQVLARVQKYVDKTVGSIQTLQSCNNFHFHLINSFYLTACLTEQSITKANRHRLRLAVIRQRSLTQLSTNAALLVATEW